MHVTLSLPTGTAITTAKAVTDASHGGIILLSGTTLARLQHHSMPSLQRGANYTPLVIPMGTHKLSTHGTPVALYSATSAKYLVRLIVAGPPKPPAGSGSNGGDKEAVRGSASSRNCIPAPECNLVLAPKPLRSLEVVSPGILSAPVGMVTAAAVRVAGMWLVMLMVCTGQVQGL